MSEQFTTICKLLNAWRGLPAYQLERRADIFFALYLPDIMKKHPKIEVTINYNDIIPEFPIQIDNTSYSNKVDYAVFSENSSFLIELKTTLKSFNIKQVEDFVDKINKEYCGNSGPNKLINGVNALIDISSDLKYINLKNRIENLPKKQKNIKVTYILPKMPKESNRINSTSKRINTLIENDNIIVITFADIMNVLKPLFKEDDLARIFHDALEIWQNEPEVSE